MTTARFPQPLTDEEDRRARGPEVQRVPFCMPGGGVKRSVEFDLETKSEANQRFASKGGMRAKSDRVRTQRAAVRDVLRASFQAPKLSIPSPRLAHAGGDAHLVTNKITVRLTRIAQGSLDDDNLRSAFKAVRDEIASWIGTNDRDPIITWEYGEERAAQHVYRIRIEVRDLSPGESPPPVILAETASEGRAAKSRVKRLVNAETKRSEAASGERSKKAQSSSKDPGDEQPARELADCTTCGAKVPTPCVRRGVERLVHGVHVARARAAGLHVEPDDRAAVKPARGARRVVPAAQPSLAFVKSWALLPWEQPTCDACGGSGTLLPCDVQGPASGLQTPCTTCNGTGRKGRRFAHLPRFDAVETPPEHLRYAVPEAHRARWADTITLHRRRTSTPRLGEIWLYEERTVPT